MGTGNRGYPVDHGELAVSARAVTVDPTVYAVELRGSWHLVTIRTVGDRQVRELWEMARLEAVPAGSVVLPMYGYTWLYVSRMQ